MLHLSTGLDIYIAFLAFVLGSCFGSFLNCMSWRIVHNESVLKGRSHCDKCGKTLGLRDLIPIVSYVAHRGRCRFCGSKLSKGHLVAELCSGVTFVLIIFKFDISLQALEMLLFACVLLAAAFADLEGYIIPDRYIIAGIVLRIPFFFLLPDTKAQIVDALLGGFAVGGGLLAVVLLYEKARKVEAMGGGDLKLLFLTGLYLGWAKNFLCLLLACLLGIAFGALTQKSRAGQENAKLFPWGPSISAAAIITVLVGDGIVSAYMSLF